jgi:hypothetical protein
VLCAPANRPGGTQRQQEAGDPANAKPRIRTKVTIRDLNCNLPPGQQLQAGKFPADACRIDASIDIEALD